MKLFIVSSVLLYAVDAFQVSSPSVLRPTAMAEAIRTTTILSAAPGGRDVEDGPMNSFGRAFAATALSLGILATSMGVTAPPPAFAGGSEVVGEIQGSGLIFKDSLIIEHFDDPKIKGVSLYISNFQRPLTEKISSGAKFFDDPSYASVGCARTGGKVQVADNIAKGPGGEQVFTESRSLLFKSLRVQRVFDEQRNTVVYVSFNTRLDKNDDTNKSRFKSSLCAVNLDDPVQLVSEKSASEAEPVPVDAGAAKK